MSDAWQQLVNILNLLQEETGTEVLSINFNRSDVPVDWDDETKEWTIG